MKYRDIAWFKHLGNHPDQKLMQGPNFPFILNLNQVTQKQPKASRYGY